MRENQAYMDSYEAKINKMKVAWQQFALTMEEAVIGDSIIAITNSLTTLGGILTFTVDNFGLLPPVLGIIGLTAALLSKNFAATTISVLTLGRGFDALGISATRAKLAMRGLAVASVVGGAFVAIGLVLDTLISDWAKHTEAVNKNREAQEKSIASLRTNETEIRKLLSRYTELSTQTGLTAEENKEFLSIQNQLNESMPSLTLHIDEQGQAHLRSAQNIEIEIKHLEKLQRIQDEIRKRDIDKNRDNVLANIEKQKEALSDLEYQLRLAQSPLTLAGQGTEDNLSLDIEDQNYKVEQSYQAIAESINKNVEASLRLKYANDSLTNEDRKYIVGLAEKESEVLKSIKNSDEQKSAYDKVNKSVEEQAFKIAELRSQLGSAGSSVSIAELLKMDQKQIDAMDNLNQKVAEGSQDWKQLQASLEETGISASVAESAIQALANNQLKASSATESMSDSIDEATSAEQTFAEVISETINEVYSLYDAYNTLNKGEKLSLDTILSLIQKYPELQQHLVLENGQLALNKEGVELLAKAKNIEFTNSLNQKKKELEESAKLLKSKLSIYSGEVEALEKLDKAKYLSNANSIAEAQYLEQKFNEYKKIMDEINSINVISKIDFSTGTPPPPPKEEKPPKDEPKTLDATDAQINAINADAEAQQKRNEILKESISSEDAFSVRLKNTNDLIAGQTSEINKLNKANNDLKTAMTTLDDTSNYDMSLWLDKNGEATKKYIDLYNSLTKGSEQDKLQELFNQYQKYSQAINENKDAIEELLPSQAELIKQIEEIKLERTQEHLESLSDAIEKFDEKIEKSKRIQSLFAEGSKEYNDETKKQIQLLSDKQELILKDIAWAEKRLKQGDLTAKQIKELNEFIKAQKSLLEEVIITQNEYSIEWQNSVKDAAKEAMKVLEDYYKQQADLESDSLDKQLDAYENYINERKKLLSQQFEEEDFQKDRQKLQKEELELRAEIDKLMLDNSFEAQSKREDLNKELQKKLEEIADLELDHNRKKRSDNYDDLLDSKQKEIQAAKDKVEEKWQAELNADQYYSGLKQSLLEGNVEKMRSTLEKFSLNIQSYMDAIGASIDLNLINKMNMTDQFTEVGKSIDTVLGTQPSDSSTGQYDSATIAAWKEYLNNKKKAEAIKTPSNKEFQALKKRNDELRKQHNFRDGSFPELSASQYPMFSAKSGGMTPKWGANGKVGILHEEELIMNKVQTKDILKVHEWTQSMIGKIKTLDFSNIIKQPQVAGASVINNQYLTFNLSGKATQSDADLFVKTLENHNRRR
ncbi:hypothetical protein ACFQZE_07450 [Paenibacillus sp. GCM10027627]|uniref:hypothetical protein n=1 Tax=unclassified Paenibacillus TaxID=185978 RepID=UPI003640E0F8